MHKILMSPSVIESVDRYIFSYKSYFHDLYSDTGIFSEELILEKYEEEAKNRHREIFDRIYDRLTPDVIHGHTLENTLFLPWRSKTLFIAWKDEGDLRIVTHLTIR